VQFERGHFDGAGLAATSTPPPQGFSGLLDEPAERFAPSAGRPRPAPVPIGPLAPPVPVADSQGCLALDDSRPVRRAEAALVVLAAALAGLGLVMVYDASGILAERYGSTTYFLVRQAAWVVVGAVALLVVRSVDYHFLVRSRRSIVLVTVALLVLVLVPGVGAKLNGARRWFRFLGLSLQPSDFAKLGLVVYLSGFLADPSRSPRDWRAVLPCLAATGVVVALVALEPDLGTAALLGCVGASVLFAGGVRLRVIAAACALVLPVGAAYAFVRLDYARARLLSFLDPSADPLGAGYHVRQSLIALSSGGVFGRGLGRGSQKLFFLPEAHTDFIFAIVGEELGLLGALLVLAAFAGIVMCALAISRRAPDRAGSLLALGMGLWIGLQAALNVAVVTASVPTKGLPLPLVSYGGSSAVATGIALGVLLNVASHARGFGRSLALAQAPQWGASTGGVA